MFSKGTALPPRSLTALIIGITVVPLATLLWLGWRLLEQDRILENQQARQRVELAADLVVAALQRVLSSSEQRLAAGGNQWPEGTVVVTFRGGLVEAAPRERVAYLPVVKPLREAPDSTFAQGDELEFRRRDQTAAVQVFRRAGEIPGSSGPGRRAPASRAKSFQRRPVSRSARRIRLVVGDGRRCDQRRASRIDRPICALQAARETKRGTDPRSEAMLLDTELHSGRWALTAPVYWLYAGDAARWTGSPRERQAEVFGEAAGALWERWNSMPPGKRAPSGRESLTVDGQTLAVLWQISAGSFRALLAAPGFVNRSGSKPSRRLSKTEDPIGAPRFRREECWWNLRDWRGSEAPRGAPSEAALPWSVAAWSIDPPGQRRDFALRRQLLIVGFALLVSMALVASFLIFRAVSREFALARLQSDFVAAVSHEFRTPLTALRQFTDMLREHGDLTDDRRRICYDAQSRATDRLTRLVESLLDFGRMEAGARPYVFERRDCGELVARVVADFRGEAQAAGYQIEFHGNGPAWIEATARHCRGPYGTFWTTPSNTRRIIARSRSA